MSIMVERERGWFRRMMGGVVFGTATLLIALWAIVALEAGEIRAHHYRALGIETRTLARVYAESVERLIGQVDTALLVLRDQYRATGEGDLTDFARLSALLREGPLADEVLQIAVIGADGFLRFSDLKRPAQPVDLSDRAHFRAHIDTAEDRLYISKPVQGRVSGKWSVQLTRRMVDGDGRFVGVLVLSVNPEVFSSRMSVLNARPDGVLTLIDRDLAVLSRSAEIELYLGRSLPEEARAAVLPPAPPAVRRGYLDGETRMIGYAPVASRPLLAGVALDVESTEAVIRKEVMAWVAWAALLSVVLLAAAATVIRSLRVRKAVQGELVSQRQHMVDAQAAAHVGSWEWLLTDNVLKWSDETMRIFGVDAAAFRAAPQTFFERVHPEDRERVEAALRATLDTGRSHEIEYRIVRPDGSERVVLGRGHLQGDPGGNSGRMLGVVLDISDRRRLEASLQEVERRWNWALEAARDGVWDWHVAEGRIYFSPRWKAMLGFAPDELPDCYESWRDRIHPVDLPRVMQALEQHFSHRTEHFEPEYRMRAKDGSWRWMLARGRVFEWSADGRPLRMLGTHTDLTERKQAELALEVERRRLVEAQAVARLGSWEWDIERGSMWWSRETYRLFGVAPDTTPTYAGYLEQVHAEDRAAVEAAVADSLSGRLPYRVDHRIVRPDGSELIVEVQARVEYGEDGSARRMVGTMHDVTESRRLERALRDANLRWRFALDGSGDGVWDRDLRTGKVFFSQRWKEMLGYADSEIGDEPAEWSSRVHPDDLPRATAALQAHLAGQIPVYVCEYRLRHKLGSYRWILARGRVVERDVRNQPLRLIGTHSDITARKEAELALAESEQRLQALIAGMAEGVVVQQRDGHIVLCNAAAERLLGLSAGEVRGEDVPDPSWGAVREDGTPLPAEAHPATVSLLSGDECRGVIMGVRRSDGGRAWLLVNSRPLFHEGEEAPYATVTTFSDITRSKEAALAAQLADAIVEQTSQPIVVTDPEGVVVRANPAFCKTLGFPLDQVRGRPIGAFMSSGRHDEDFYAGMWSVLRGEGRWEGEIWNRRSSGDVIPEWLSITAIRDLAGRVQQYVGIYTDMTERKQREDAMWRRANYDALTELPNRLLLNDRLLAGMARARRSGGRLAVLFVDLDHFKPVNDTYGHRVGDVVLRAIAGRLLACVREEDTVARISGDEFVAVLHSLSDAAAADRVARAMLAAATEPVDADGHLVKLSCSIGIALFPDHGDSVGELLERADAAMYRVKQAGRNGFAHCKGEVVFTDTEEQSA